ncbi:MAG: EamA family transporter [Candidatus Omnitrophota bacterium]
MKSWLILLLSVLLTSIGQLTLKKGLLAFGSVEGIGVKFFQMLVHPLVMFGVTFAILGWVAYVIALSQSELSYAYPIWSLSYVVVPLFSLFIFRESISFFKLAGLSFIFIGVLFVILSSR